MKKELQDYHSVILNELAEQHSLLISQKGNWHYVPPDERTEHSLWDSLTGSGRNIKPESVQASLGPTTYL